MEKLQMKDFKQVIDRIYSIIDKQGNKELIQTLNKKKQQIDQILEQHIELFDSLDFVSQMSLLNQLTLLEFNIINEKANLSFQKVKNFFHKKMTNEEENIRKNIEQLPSHILEYLDLTIGKYQNKQVHFLTLNQVTKNEKEKENKNGTEKLNLERVANSDLYRAKKIIETTDNRNGFLAFQYNNQTKILGFMIGESNNQQETIRQQGNQILKYIITKGEQQRFYLSSGMNLIFNQKTYISVEQIMETKVKQQFQNHFCTLPRNVNATFNSIVKNQINYISLKLNSQESLQLSMVKNSNIHLNEYFMLPISIHLYYDECGFYFSLVNENDEVYLQTNNMMFCGTDQTINIDLLVSDKERVHYKSDLRELQNLQPKLFDK